MMGGDATKNETDGNGMGGMMNGGQMGSMMRGQGGMGSMMDGGCMGGGMMASFDEEQPFGLQFNQAQEPEEDVEDSRWRYSLMNRDHDPLK